MFFKLYFLKLKIISNGYIINISLSLDFNKQFYSSLNFFSCFFLNLLPLFCRINNIIHIYYFFIKMFDEYYFICSRAIEILLTRANGSPPPITLKNIGRHCMILMNAATLRFGLVRFSLFFTALLRVPL